MWLRELESRSRLNLEESTNIMGIAKTVRIAGIAGVTGVTGFIGIMGIVLLVIYHGANNVGI